MNTTEQKKEARAFMERWQGTGYEMGETQPFWTDLLEHVFGVASPKEQIHFEVPVKLEGKHTGRIDALIPQTHVMIEQKKLGADLSAPIRQSDGTRLRPIDQARRYAMALPYSERPRWIVICNFQTFHIYDLETPQSDPVVLALKSLPKEIHYLSFLVQERNEKLIKEIELSVKAGEIVGKLYDALLTCYVNSKSEASLKSLNVLCVRLVFCLYAEKADIFGSHSMLHDYLKRFEPQDMRRAFLDLFQVLDTEEKARDPYLAKDLASFPYVNGGLFRDAHIEIPNFTAELKALLLEEASAFEWNEISPTIFGAVFESTLNPETRRQGGMHYTSIENIHKLIDPLFLDDLKAELAEILALKTKTIRHNKLMMFQEKLASLQFLDPAAGSGNFLTETYLSLRHLENELLKDLKGDQVLMGAFDNPVKVSIEQFHGMEINDFAVSVAKCALWIAESQMLGETKEIMDIAVEFLPLKTHANIIEGNALQLDWAEVMPKEKLNYIMGNPPFVGASMMNAEQKRETVAIIGERKLSHSIDYVAGWYYKAAQLMQGTEIQAAFVSTNSITQGEQVAPLWGKLLQDYHLQIIFARRTFRWDSESNAKAHVHCVVIGFTCGRQVAVKRLFAEKQMSLPANISPYLLDAPNILVTSRPTPLCDVPKMTKGNQPSDGGNLILSAKEREEILKKEPALAKFIHLYVGAQEYIKRVIRYCFWLVDASPSDILGSKILKERVAAVKAMREKSSAKPTREKATIPHLFFFIAQPKGNYIFIPRVSSENRRYVPLGFLPPSIIASDSASIIPNATLYHFGVLTSNVHMAWMRAVAGRLKSDYRYSGSVVYNTFPWPNATTEQKEAITQTAQGILDARAAHKTDTLAALYNELTMPKDLRQAHQANDRAVMQAYGFSIKMNESECLGKLLGMYAELIAKG